ncbi:MAG: sulfite exporter TauE/SafE family protein [Rhodocyclaceae bacterium]|nr:MAG: sulfite exporter TauE/SafE family protein [Rhodocyclaceae bacterium]
MILAGAMAIAGLGGVIRGATGFGGAMVMTPTLSLLLGPIPAVVSALLLETFAAFSMLPAAARHANWRTIAPIFAAAFITVPLGGYLLLTLDPQLMRRAIAATVLVFSLLLLTGLRYRGRQRLGTSLALGASSGVLVGATSVGAPPVILYLLASSDPPAVTRANLTLFVTIISLAALVMLLWRGMLDGPNALTALLLSPVYFGGVWLGSRLYGRIDAAIMRRWTLIFLVVVSAVVLAL